MLINLMKKQIEKNIDEILIKNGEDNTELTDDEIFGAYSTVRIMKYWPVPESYTDELPKFGSLGSFWRDRGDRYHCGIDIFAPPGSAVIAIESGQVVDKGIFTSPSHNRYWNTTSYITIKSSENILYKYASLSQTFIHVGDFIEGGQDIGLIGLVINKFKIAPQTPMFVREYIENNLMSMLHLEMYKSPISEVRPYSGGNYFGRTKPDSLLDPNVFLYQVRKKD